MKTVNEFIDYAKQELRHLYGVSGMQQIIFLLLEEVMGFSRTDLHMRKNDELDEKSNDKLNGFIQQLKEGSPLQYVLGYAWFRGMKLIVNENVLIPRPETEELVEWILSDPDCYRDSILNTQYSVFDIGTGSGCIAISIRKAIPSAKVYAIDISDKALKVASQNAELNSADILFQLGDILSPDFRNIQEEKYDMIVSNPPYVQKNEMEAMSRHVRDFEPPAALFVDNNDPLIFYRAIAEFAKTHLIIGGQLFFEINEAFGNAVKSLLLEYGFQNVELKKDISGKDRMIRASAIPNYQIV